MYPCYHIGRFLIRAKVAPLARPQGAPARTTAFTWPGALVPFK